MALLRARRASAVAGSVLVAVQNYAPAKWDVGQHVSGGTVVSRWQRARKRPVEVDVRGPIEHPESIDTLEGIMHASPGDFIVRGVRGEEYPIKPSIFEITYELIDPH